MSIPANISIPNSRSPPDGPLVQSQISESGHTARLLCQGSKVYGFQSLPPEITLKIWRATYAIIKPGDKYIGSSKNGCATSGQAFKTEIANYVGHAARRLCHRFNDEILDEFLQNNGFEFFHTNVFLEFMQWAGAKARTWIKRLRLHFSISLRTESSNRAAHRIYTALRYLKSCTSLSYLEIHARVIPEKVKSSWLGYPVLNALTIVFSSTRVEDVIIDFGPEQRYRSSQQHLNLQHYLVDPLDGKTEIDLKMIALTQDVLKQAFMKMAKEFSIAAKSNKRSLADISKDKSQPWKGVSVRVKAQRAHDRKETAKKSKPNPPTIETDGSEVLDAPHVDRSNATGRRSRVTEVHEVESDMSGSIEGVQTPDHGALTDWTTINDAREPYSEFNDYMSALNAGRGVPPDNKSTFQHVSSQSDLNAYPSSLRPSAQACSTHPLSSQHHTVNDAPQSFHQVTVSTHGPYAQGTQDSRPVQSHLAAAPAPSSSEANSLLEQAHQEPQNLQQSRQPDRSPRRTSASPLTNHASPAGDVSPTLSYSLLDEFFGVDPQDPFGFDKAYAQDHQFDRVG